MTQTTETLEPGPTLDVPYRVTEEQIQQFEDRGHLLLKRVFEPELLAPLRRHLLNVVGNYPKVEPIDDNNAAYSNAFKQYLNVGLEDPFVARITQSRRIAQLTADLMKRSSRLFLEDLFIKEPGMPYTPFHQDASAFPLDFAATITAWIPLQDSTVSNGGLRVITQSHKLGIAGPQDITAENHLHYEELSKTEN